VDNRLTSDTIVATHFELEVPGQQEGQWIFEDTFADMGEAVTVGRNYEDANIGTKWRVVQVQCHRTVLRESGVYPEGGMQ